MHISEGYLPVAHSIAWTAAAVPVAFASYRSLDLRNAPRQRRLLIAASAGFLFAMTALKFPSVAGSSSHPTGIALGTILLGLPAMPILAMLVLLFQALLLAHGGLTTLGANTMSLGVAGPLAVAAVWHFARRLRCPESASLVAAALIGSLFTYATTSLQLAMAFPDTIGGAVASFGRFFGIFAVVQVPVALVESILTWTVWRALQGQREQVVA